MMDSLFDNYIVLTKNILSGIKNGISVDEFFEKREELISSIIKDESSKEDKKKAYVASGAEELDKCVVEYIRSEMEKTKEDIRKANTNKKLYSSYVSNNMKGSFFRRTI